MPTQGVWEKQWSTQRRNMPIHCYYIQKAQEKTVIKPKRWPRDLVLFDGEKRSKKHSVIEKVDNRLMLCIPPQVVTHRWGLSVGVASHPRADLLCYPLETASQFCRGRRRASQNCCHHPPPSPTHTHTCDKAAVIPHLTHTYTHTHHHTWVNR